MALCSGSASDNESNELSAALAKSPRSAMPGVRVQSNHFDALLTFSPQRRPAAK